MAQPSGMFPALNDNTKKRVTSLMQAAPAQKKRSEPTPGLMATRNVLRGIRSSTIPKGHPKRG